MLVRIGYKYFPFDGRFAHFLPLHANDYFIYVYMCMLFIWKYTTGINLSLKSAMEIFKLTSYYLISEVRQTVRSVHGRKISRTGRKRAVRVGSPRVSVSGLYWKIRPNLTRSSLTLARGQTEITKPTTARG